MARGDHLWVHSRFAGITFEHHGIDMADGTVVHLAAEDGVRIAIHDDTQKFRVRRDSWEAFCKGQIPNIIAHDNALPVDEIVARAETQVGKSGYNLLDNNCEHFATACCTGTAASRQAEMGQQAAISGASLMTKLFWAVSARLASNAAVQTATRVAVKSNPLLLLADGAELATLAVSCRAGLSAQRSREVAHLSGSLVAVGIGGAVGGPAGAMASLALHRSSTYVAEQTCGHLRRMISQGLGRVDDPTN